MSDKVYDLLSKIQRFLPALGIAVVGLCATYGWNWGSKAQDTIGIVATLLAAILEIFAAKYNAALKEASNKDEK